MKKIVLANQKGGVGKTIFVRHLYFAAVERRLRTLVIDWDSQANTTKTLMHLADPAVIERGGWLTAANIFQKKSKAQPMPVTPLSSLIAADAELVDVGDYSLDMIVQPRQILEKFDDQFDVCLIDTPPSQGKLLFAALACADYVLSPCTLDEDATDGLAALFQDVERVRQMKWNPNLQIMGIQVNKMAARGAYDRKALAELREQIGDMVMPNIVFERAATRLAIRRPVWRGTRGVNRGAAAVEMKDACNAVLNSAGF